MAKHVFRLSMAPEGESDETEDLGTVAAVAKSKGKTVAEIEKSISGWGTDRTWYIISKNQCLVCKKTGMPRIDINMTRPELVYCDEHWACSPLNSENN